MTQDWAVRLKMITSDGKISTVVKTFTSEQARAGWLAKNEDDVLEILGWEDPS